jgi:hypothetical protein
MVKTTIPIREFCDPYRSSVFEDGKKTTHHKCAKPRARKKHVHG